jgi:murein endopeptidase
VVTKSLAHLLALGAVWLAGGSAVPEPVSAAPVAMAIDIDDVAPALSPPPQVPFVGRAQINLDAVWWTTPRNEPLLRLADRWGLHPEQLVALNPALTEVDKVAAGERLCVYRYDPDTVSRSVGAPNNGHLEHGAPFIEGEAWILREYRPRSWATRHVVAELAAQLSAFHDAHPDAQPIKLGEISQRGGGKIKPHRSHRSGRDVDLGYVMLEFPEGHRHVAATPATLDAAATWALVQQLRESGTVERIFMARSVQAQLLSHAKATLDPAELPAVFSILADDHRGEQTAFLRDVPGHEAHMHIRFACTEGDESCRIAQRRRGKKNKRGQRKRRRR